MAAEGGMSLRTPAGRLMKVAFQPIGGERWLGGLHYLTALLSALRDHAREDVEPVLIARRGADKDAVRQLAPLFPAPPIHLSERSSRVGRALEQGVFARDKTLEVACRARGVDVMFQHSEWLGPRFGLPTVAWLGDFQHRYLPELFPWHLFWMRELRFRAVLRSASILYVLSETDRRAGCRLYPRHGHKLRALPFAVTVPDEAWSASPDAVREKHRLPRQYFLFPGQLWKHKNHLAVLEAIATAKRRGRRVTVACTGRLADHRDRGHAARVAARVSELGLEEDFLHLGLLQRPEVWALMRASVAVLNPSLYEGWSTPVEEAKAIGAPLVLSDLAVHREQSPRQAKFFSPRHPEQLARVMNEALDEWGPGPRPRMEELGREELSPRRRAFARDFVSLVRVAEGGASDRPA